MFSFLNLCLLSFLSCFISACAQFIFKTHLMVKVTCRGVIFSLQFMNKHTEKFPRGCAVMGFLAGFVCFLYLNVFCVSVMDYCGQRTRAGTALSIATQFANVYSLPPWQLGEITAEPRRRWMEEWNLKESMQLDPVSHISQYECKSNSDKAQS